MNPESGQPTDAGGGVDVFRYFLMAEMSLGQAARFTEEAFMRLITTGGEISSGIPVK